jgi:hypothetical protein
MLCGHVLVRISGLRFPDAMHSSRASVVGGDHQRDVAAVLGHQVPQQARGGIDVLA